MVVVRLNPMNQMEKASTERRREIIESFDGTTAFVTGAASGIGLALARALASKGVKVMLADIEEGALDAALRDLRDSGAMHGPSPATCPTPSP